MRSESHGRTSNDVELPRFRRRARAFSRSGHDGSRNDGERPRRCRARRFCRRRHDAEHDSSLRFAGGDLLAEGSGIRDQGSGWMRHSSFGVHYEGTPRPGSRRSRGFGRGRCGIFHGRRQLCLRRQGDGRGHEPQCGAQYGRLPACDGSVGAEGRRDPRLRARTQAEPARHFG